MKKVKVITSTEELETFLERTDIDIIKTDIHGCEQSWFAQEYFVATIYYDDESKKEDTPDYWDKLLHQYTGMAMQGILANIDLLMSLAKKKADDYPAKYTVAEFAKDCATALVEKLKKSKV